MKKLIASLFGVFAALSLFAQPAFTVVKAIPANTVTNLLSGRYMIDEWSFYNTNTASIVVVKAYDWASSATSVVRSAYDYRTNVVVTNTTIVTNSAGLSQTNSYVELTQTNVTVAAVTNEQTKVRSYSVGPNINSDLPNPPSLARGLTVLTDGAGFITITYRPAN